MIPDLRPHGIVGAGASTARRFPIVTMLMVAAWLGGCDKMPLVAPSGTTILLYTNTQVLPVNGTAQITASVLESGGYAVQNGTTVTFTSSLGTVVPNEAKTTDGKVTVTFNAGPQSGTAVINAFSGSSSTHSSVSGGSGTGTTTPTTSGSGVSILIGAAAASTVVVTASPSSVSQLGGLATITAMVLDGNNNGLAGVPVSFATDQGTLSPVSMNTNSSGTATTTLSTNQTATVTVTAGSKTATAKVNAVAVPTITVTGPTTLPTVGVTTNFTLNVTAGTGASPIRNVVVDFGDGQSASLGAASGSITVPHVYRTTGTFTITAVATDASGQSTSASVPVIVFGPVAFQVTLTAPSGKSGVSVTLTAAPAAGSPAIDRYEWSFGDGSTAVTTEATVPHVYTLPAGTTVPQQFIATVKAVGNDGRFGVGSATVTITP